MLPSIDTLRRTWQRHYERSAGEGMAEGAPPTPRVRFKDKRALSRAAEGIESPYDVDARYRHKRDTQWTGYMVHRSETCEPTAPHLITHVHTTTATVPEALGTTAIQQALVAKDLAPEAHLVDAAYVSAALLVRSRDEQGITLCGPTRPNQSWQATVAGAYTVEQFAIDWEHQEARCPQGKRSVRWTEGGYHTGRPITVVQFATKECRACPTRTLWTRLPHQGRRLQLPPRAQYDALQAARAWYTSPAGKQRYARRAGVAGTLSQGVRAFGLRRTRYRGVGKTHLQHVATAAAINMDRIVNWLAQRPRAMTRTSRFAALAPAGPIRQQ